MKRNEDRKLTVESVIPNNPYALIAHIAEGVRKCPGYTTSEALADLLSGLSKISPDMAEEADVDFLHGVIVQLYNRLTMDQRAQLVLDLDMLGDILGMLSGDVARIFLEQINADAKNN